MILQLSYQVQLGNMGHVHTAAKQLMMEALLLGLNINVVEGVGGRITSWLKGKAPKYQNRHHMAQLLIFFQGTVVFLPLSDRTVMACSQFIRV